MPEIVNTAFDAQGMDKWACLPLNQTIPLLGSINSKDMSYLAIGIYPCNNATNNNRCAPQ